MFDDSEATSMVNDETVQWFLQPNTSFCQLHWENWSWICKETLEKSLTALQHEEPRMPVKQS